MKPYLEDPDFTLYNGEALEVLKQLPAGSVHCVVTSPPYWGLRDYGTASWEGGNPGCDHIDNRKGGEVQEHVGSDGKAGRNNTNWDHQRDPFRDVCGKCGARRVDQALGLEATPELYVERMVAVFREVRRVLRADGVCWVNLGDSYAGSPSGFAGTERGAFGNDSSHRGEHAIGRRTIEGPGLKPKDLVGIPWRVAFALQQPYYTGRIAAERDRVWMAAMVDGEGTICGFRHERPDGNVRTGCLTFITNSDERILDECDRIWPGSRYVEKLKPGDQVLGGTATRTCWRWELQSAEDRSAFVRELYPYLIAKKRQAMVAWNMLELVQAAKRMGRGGETKAIKEKRDYLAKTLSDLNQRRPVDLPSWIEEPPNLYEPGWYVRSDVIWAKNNPMPESVTDRPTKAHEYVFLLTKSARYFFDQEAVREGYDQGWAGRQDVGRQSAGRLGQGGEASRNGTGQAPMNGRNVRSVWEIATQPYPEAHFATYPEELVRRCILAGTSERGCCPECGAPWERQMVAESPDGRRAEIKNGKAYDQDGKPLMGDNMFDPGVRGSFNSGGEVLRRETVGWRSSCGHDLSPVPCTVLDPFGGSGTTALVARKHGRCSILVELSAEYCELAALRLQQLSLLSETGA